MLKAGTPRLLPAAPSRARQLLAFAPGFCFFANWLRLPVFCCQLCPLSSFIVVTLPVVVIVVVVTHRPSSTSSDRPVAQPSSSSDSFRTSFHFRLISLIVVIRHHLLTDRNHFFFSGPSSSGRRQLDIGPIASSSSGHHLSGTSGPCRRRRLPSPWAWDRLRRHRHTLVVPCQVNLQAFSSALPFFSLRTSPWLFNFFFYHFFVVTSSSMLNQTALQSSRPSLP